MKNIVNHMIQEVAAHKIILFGSRARGNAKRESAIDFSDLLIPMDILIYTPEEVREWQHVFDAFITTALREGKIIYEDPSGPGQKLVA